MQKNENVTERSTLSEMPMKWHKFLIYFSLWAGAVINVSTAVGLLTGSIYGSSGADAEMIYRFYDGLKTVDVLMGLASIALAVMLIVTRFSLAGYKKNGPKLLTIAYALNIAIALIYPLIASSVTNLGFGDLLNPSSLASSAAMLFVNKNYYAKRAHLFVN